MVEKAEEKKRKKVLVTGSCGMLGSEILKELSREYEVTGLDLLESTVHGPQSTVNGPRSAAHFIRCDITDRNETAKAIVDAKPDIIIHAAAWTDVDGCEGDPARAKKVNGTGTANVATAAKTLDVPFVYISTDFVFDGKKKTPYTENDTPNPLSAYAKSKLEGEKKVSELKKYIIVRSGWLFGKNGKNFVDAILNKAKSEKELKVVDDQIGSPTYAKDLAQAIGKVLYAIRYTLYARNEIYHISNKGEVSWFEYAKEILKLAGIKDVKIAPIKSKESGRPAKRPAFSVLDNSKFEKLTDFVMRSWQEALREYLEHI